MGQTFARVLPEGTHTNLRAMLWLVERRDQYCKDNNWTDAENLVTTEIKQTYLGEVLAQVRQAFSGQSPGDEVEQTSAAEPAARHLT